MRLIVLFALALGGIAATADDASAIGRRKKNANCCPAPAVGYGCGAVGYGGYMPAGGCGGGGCGMVGYGGYGGIAPVGYAAGAPSGCGACGAMPMPMPAPGVTFPAGQGQPTVLPTGGVLPGGALPGGAVPEPMPNK